MHPIQYQYFNIPQYNTAQGRTVLPAVTAPVYNTNLPQQNLQYPSFENNYWQYQQYQGINNQVLINQPINNYYNNLQLGNQILNDFRTKYPTIESYTMADTLARQAEQQNPMSLETVYMKNKADRLFKKMIPILDNRPDQRTITFNEYISKITKEFDEQNFANCGERAYYTYDKLNKMGVQNHGICEISGNKNYNNHVFNIIGLAPNADISNPSTWGPNAVVIDTWSNKVCSPIEAINFYSNFLGYSYDNPMQFQKLDTNLMFKAG